MQDGGYKINEIYEADIFYLLHVLSKEQGIDEEDNEPKSLFAAFGK